MKALTCPLCLKKIHTDQPTPNSLKTTEDTTELEIQIKGDMQK